MSGKGKDRAGTFTRPGVKFTELGFTPVSLQTYRTKNVWWSRLWKPKYNTHLLAISKDAIYDICNPKTPACDTLLRPAPLTEPKKGK